MICHTYETDPVKLTLPVHESQQLDAFLDRLIQRLGDDAHATTLESTSMAIGDANAVAIWLREFVRLELPTVNALELAEALTEQLVLDQHDGVDDDTVLIRLRDQIRASVCQPNFCD